jgi:putative ABC transport system permease protein
MSLWQRPLRGGMSFVVRGSRDVATLLSAMHREVEALDPELAGEAHTLAQVLSASLERRRFSLVLFGAFAFIALLLAVTGIYGVTSHAVAQRMHELGVRLALGAQPRAILTMVLALGAARLLASSLYGVANSDPATLLVCALRLAVVALVAAYLLARRAMRVDPTVALRAE